MRTSFDALAFFQQGRLLRCVAMLVFCGTAMVAPKDIGRAEDSTHVVRHALGQTRIVSHPQRIMTLGWSGEDVVLALGQTPVAMTRYGAFASGMFPWVEEKFAGPAPTLLSGDFDYEKIAALKPDLILGVYSGIDERAYKRLSAIAPTVVYRSGPWAQTGTNRQLSLEKRWARPEKPRRLSKAPKNSWVPSVRHIPSLRAKLHFRDLFSRQQWYCRVFAKGSAGGGPDRARLAAFRRRKRPVEAGARRDLRLGIA